jgi:TolB protein
MAAAACLCSLAIASISALAAESGAPQGERMTQPLAGLIGYTEYRTNLPGGRLANVTTMRACVVQADGGGRRVLAEEFARQPCSWTQFAGWSPDGSQAIVLSCWESTENAAWEEEHKEFRFAPDGWLVDCHLVDLTGGTSANLTAIDRVSFYNTGLFFWPGQPSRLGFQALIGGESRPFSMGADGSGKQDLSQQSGFAYGFGASPEGQRIAYHQDYKLVLADGDGGNARTVETGNPFNFSPRWSPDGQWVLFLSGEHYCCHPWIVRRDGGGAHKLADRGEYEGVVEFLDVPDFHGGSSDVPVWSSDSQWVYYTAKTDQAVELMRVSLAGEPEQLTHSPAGVLNYHPAVSPDGGWVVFGSTSGGRRQLHVARSDGTDVRQTTQVAQGYGAMWAYWQPR